MSFFTAIATCFRKYVSFDGRASRSEFWFFMLFCGLVYVAATFIDDALALPPDNPYYGYYLYGPVSTLMLLLVMLPVLAAT